MIWDRASSPSARMGLDSDGSRLVARRSRGAGRPWRGHLCRGCWTASRLLASRHTGSLCKPCPCDLGNPAASLGLRRTSSFQPERLVLLDRHTGIQGVVLEHHAGVLPIRGDRRSRDGRRTTAHRRSSPPSPRSSATSSTSHSPTGPATRRSRPRLGRGRRRRPQVLDRRRSVLGALFSSTRAKILLRASARPSSPPHAGHVRWSWARWARYEAQVNPLRRMCKHEMKLS